MHFIKTTILLASALTLLGTGSTIAATAQDGNVPVVPEVQAPSLSDPSLDTLGKNYRVSPNQTSWTNYLNAFKLYLAKAPGNKASANQVIHANPSLKDLGVKVFDVGGGRTWLFPNIKEKSVLFLQSGESVDQIDYPDNVNLLDARLLRSTVTTTRVVKKGRKKITQKIVTATGPKYLILTGQNRANGVIWLKAYKPYGGAWIPTDDPFSAVPPYLLNNVSGEVDFVGNNIVMSVSASDAKNAKLPKPNSTSYRITLVSSGGKFTLMGSSTTNQPGSLAAQFAQSLHNNRVDLAKALLHDPALISIPKYIGLLGNAPAKPYKLVAMATPKSGGPRYRLVTYKKHDLIIEVGKVYSRVAIKGLFIAPPDPLAEKLSGTLIGAPPQTETPTAQPVKEG